MVSKTNKIKAIMNNKRLRSELIIKQVEDILSGCDFECLYQMAYEYLTKQYEKDSREVKDYLRDLDDDEFDEIYDRVGVKK